MNEPRVLSIVDRLPPAANAPDPDVVAALENWLERAKAGQLRGICIAAALNEGPGSSTYAATFIETGEGNLLVLGAAVGSLSFRYHNHLLNMSSGPPPQPEGSGDKPVPDDEAPTEPPT